MLRAGGSDCGARQPTVEPKRCAWNEYEGLDTVQVAAIGFASYVVVLVAGRSEPALRH